jgi:hypothetical protein
MQRKLRETRKNLNAIYINWGEQLNGLSKENYDLTSSTYSKPYYISVLDDWFSDKKIRILIVGEEGRGNWNVDGWKDLNAAHMADIEKIIAWHKGYFETQLGIKNDKKFTYNRSAFWRRVRRINTIKNCVCAWTNLDKIHHNGQKNCALTKKERILLHSISCKILKEEIHILKPNIVLFCGYTQRRDAFFAELPTVAEKFYANQASALPYEQLYNTCIYRVADDGILYIFTQHPNRKSKEYELQVINAIQEAINRV